MQTPSIRVILFTLSRPTLPFPNIYFISPEGNMVRYCLLKLSPVFKECCTASSIELESSG